VGPLVMALGDEILTPWDNFEAQTLDGTPAKDMHRYDHRVAGSRPRSAAAAALRDSDGGAVERSGMLEAAVVAADDACPAVRRDVAEMLGNALTSAYAQAPFRLRQDRNTDMVVDALIRLLEGDESDQVRWAAAHSLARLSASGVDVAAAIGYLNSAFAHDNDRYVVAAAFNALRLIGVWPEKYQPPLGSDVGGDIEDVPVDLHDKFARVRAEASVRVDKSPGLF